MEASQKLVIRIPLDALWREDGAAISERVGPLSVTDIADLLRIGAVRFVIADVGRPLEWIPSHQCFEFWKAKVKHNVCRAEEKILPDAYPQSYCFSASLWRGEEAAVVLLEKHH